MKKFVTLALALIMALSLAAPALAFTGIEATPDAETPVELAIKLVDVTEGFVNSNFNAPASNRGYVKNEVVCAVVSMYVPKGVDPSDDFDVLVFSGSNVSLLQSENFPGKSGEDGILTYMSANATAAVIELSATKEAFSYADDMSIDNSITLDFSKGADGNGMLTISGTPVFKNTSSNQTYYFAIFGKVVGDDASMSATLKGTLSLKNADDLEDGDFRLNRVAVDNDYSVSLYDPNSEWETTHDGMLFPSAIVALLGSKNIVYVVESAQDEAANLPAVYKNTQLFGIVTDKNYNCEKIIVFNPSDKTDDTPYFVNIVGKNAKYAVKADFWNTYLQFEDLTDGSILDPSDSDDGILINGLLNWILEDIVYDEFGLDITVNGQLKPSWWAGNKTLSAEVAIEPWYAEVTVPPEIEIEIPKTGDALSVMGFVLIALAGLAVVAVRKVKA